LLYNTNQIKKSYPLYHTPLFFKPEKERDPTKHHKRLFFELEEQNYNEISKAFKKVYPGIYDGLEKYWQETTKSLLINQIEAKRSFIGKKIDCNHKWNPVHIFKLEGEEYYHCRRCNNVIDGSYYHQFINTKQPKNLRKH
jgi:hypothetical protein